MVQIIYLITAVSVGIIMSLQPAVNAVMARGLGSALLASVMSITISFLLICTTWQLIGKGQFDIAKITQLPWWVLIGGVAGVCIVLAGILIAPMLGLALFFVCMIAGQLLGSTVIDHFGAFDAAVRPINAMKVAGLVLVIAGAALVEFGNHSS
ncbi:MAG: DMT family transporter [Pseudomonadota bacterium]